EKLLLHPAPTLRLRAEQIRCQFRGAFLLTPDPRLPIRILIVLLDVAGETGDVAMKQPVLQLGCRSVHDHVLVYFHVGHRGVLVSGAALESSLASTEERQFVESRAAVL